MPRVTHVKAARQDNPVAKKGEPYYWWKSFRSPKQYSRTYPRQSQLCSGKKSLIYSAQESLTDALGDACTGEELVSAIEECAEQFTDIGAEYEESADNMPENLQYTEQTENMREQGEYLSSAADELTSVDCDDAPDMEDFDFPNVYSTKEDSYTYETEEEAVEAYDEEMTTWLDEKKEEITGIADEVEILF